MQSHQYEEITLVLCESCFEFIDEQQSEEIEGQSYCSQCAEVEVTL